MLFLQMLQKLIFSQPWIKCIHSMYNSCGLSYMWENQTSCSLMICVSQWKIQIQFVQEWRGIVNKLIKCINYWTLKTNFNLESIFMSSRDLQITKFRTCNRRFSMETGKWNNIDKNLNKCRMCYCKSVGVNFITF